MNGSISILKRTGVWRTILCPRTFVWDMAVVFMFLKMSSYLSQIDDGWVILDFRRNVVSHGSHL